MKLNEVEGYKVRDSYIRSEYSTWIGMKKRCHSPDNKDYHNYGARGITVCDEWIHSFDTFLKDMGKRPSKYHSLDRVRNDEGYSKSNCRWATAKEQSINRRSTNWFEYNGKMYTMELLASLFNTSRDKVKYYLRKGETVQQLEKRFIYENRN